MNSITALIDHTEISDRVIEFTRQIALSKGIKAHLLTVVPRGENTRSQECWDKLTAYNDAFYKDGIEVELHLIEGGFFDVIERAIDKLHTSMVIIGTHGKKGLKQHIFGSNILKLVQMLNVPSLVIQDDSTWPEDGFSKVLFPVAAHTHFERKLEQTKGLISANGSIDLYTIYKGDKMDEDTAENVSLCKEYFESEGVKYTLVEEDATIYSVGYSRQTLEFAKNEKPDLISIAAKQKGDSKVFSNGDKENIILNESEIPVLCCH